MRRTLAPLQAKGYAGSLAYLAIDPQLQTITVHGRGDMPVFFALTPRFILRVEATSAFRVLVK